MEKRIFGLLIFLLLGGCSGSGETEDQAKSTEDAAAETAVSESGKMEEETVKGAASWSEELKGIESFLVPETEEELAAQTGGIFTEDISYAEETKQSWGNFGLGDYEQPLTEKLTSVSEATQDPEAIFKALHFYIGSHAYNQAINELNEFTVDWYEPYLPEPSEMEQEENAVDPGKAVILLDASSSMLLNVEGQQKMGIAKTAAIRFANTIGNTNDVSLMVYGHAGSQNSEDKELSCTTIEEVYPSQPFEAEKFTQAVANVEAKGWTPIGNAIKAAKEKMAGSSENVTLYIISDGAETCDGDPVAEAKAFAAENANRTVNIIGFDVDQAGENALKEVAAAGNGEYISAKTVEELNNSIKKAWVPSFQEVASKSNSLIKQWGQSYDEMTERTKLADKIYYAGLNEKSRFYEAINIMRAQKMITNETYEEIKTLIEDKAAAVLEIRKQLDLHKMEENEEKRQQIIKRVQEWTDRMNTLRANQ